MGPMKTSGRTVSARIASALAEVGLIFVGITLAIAFENWNSERAERRDEAEILLELRADLGVNMEELEQALVYNHQSLARIDTVLGHLEARLPYSPVLSSSLSYLENWASPYLSRSAYETLKSRGLNLISDGALRAAVVRLYENTYVDLVNDADRSEWINYEVSMIPLMLRAVEERPGQLADPVDYAALLDDRAFRTALLRTKSLRMGTIGTMEWAVAETAEVRSRIAASPGGGGP